MDLDAVVEDLHANPHRARNFYEYPAVYDFFHSRVLDRDAQVRLLRRHEPAETDRVLELGCGTGPLLARIEDDYETVVGVDANNAMLDAARDRVDTADVRREDFTVWSPADDGLTVDLVVLFGGLLHVTSDDALRRLAKNVHAGLRAGGAFVTFFQPFDEAVANGNREVQTAESDRYTVERHSVSALTSGAGHYTTTYCFEIHDRQAGREAQLGTVFEGRFHAPDRLCTAFSDAGFETAEVVDGDGPTVLRAEK